MGTNKKTTKCLFVGDIALGDHPKTVGFGFYSKYKNGIPNDKAEQLFPDGITADVVFGNLEFNIGADRLANAGFEYLNCRGISQYADFLKKSGFNVLNMANNHIFQHGWNEFDKTAKLLTSKGIAVVGLKDDQNHGNILHIDDQPIAFLAWSARPRQGFVCNPPYKEFDEDQCCREIENAKSIAPIICVSLHWGEEFIEIPSAEEKRIARNLIDCGANIVVGHHPHVIREVEKYNGGLIAYSLGNFICDMTWNEKTRRTACLYVEFGGQEISKWDMIHGRIDDSFFPVFPKLSSDLSAVYADLYKKFEDYSYDTLAHLALRQHQVLTILHMIRNCFRYSPEVWKSMFLGAIKSRLKIKGRE